MACIISVNIAHQINLSPLAFVVCIKLYKYVNSVRVRPMSKQSYIILRLLDSQELT